LDKIQPKILQRDGVVMVKMKVLVMMVMKMMIPMKASSMVMTMAMICLPESFFSLNVFRPAEAAKSISDPPWGLRFLGTTRGWPAPPGGVGPWLLPSFSPSGYFCLLVKYEFLGIFLELLIFRNMMS
jgi:hypothetical protein